MPYYIVFLISVLLVRKFRLAEENAVEMLHHYGGHLSSSFLVSNFNHFEKNNSIIVLLFIFYIFMPLASLWISSGSTSIRSSALWEVRWHLIEGENLYGTNSVLSYFSRLRRCPLSLSLARRYRYLFSLLWEWDQKTFLIHLFCF